MADPEVKKSLDFSKDSRFVLRCSDQLQTFINDFFCEHKLSILFFCHLVFFFLSLFYCKVFDAIFKTIWFFPGFFLKKAQYTIVDDIGQFFI